MNCYYCKKEIDLDLPTLVKVEAPNAIRFASTMESAEKIEKQSTEYYCSFMCLMTKSLKIIASPQLPFSPEVRKVSRYLVIMITMESTGEEFVNEIRKAQKKL